MGVQLLLLGCDYLFLLFQMFQALYVTYYYLGKMYHTTITY